MKRTIPRLLRAAATARPAATWLVSDATSYTFETAVARVERGAAALRAAGVRRGDRVLTTPRTTPEYALSWLSIMDVGAVQVPVNPLSSTAELQGFLDQVEPAAVVTDVDVAMPPAPGAMCIDIDELFSAEPDAEGFADVEPEDLAVFIPTSGTTGRSKLVMQTHLAYVMAGEGFPWWLELTSDDRLMTSLPLFHLNAPAYSVLGSLVAGARLILLPSFSGRGFLDAARRHGATEFNAIGAMVEILMGQPARDDDADNPIRLCYTGPSPEQARQKEIEARFGWRIMCGYALSESPYGLVWRRGERPYGTLGSARQHPELGQVNDARVRADGADVAPGEVGELELRNPTVMRGYYQMPDATAAVLRDGWLRTGDLVRANGDGTYTFVGRAKDVIRRRGENLSPAEVEAALETHPAVAEAAVIAVPSQLSEDDVKAFVVAVPGAAIDAFELHDHAAAGLARFKVPRYIEVVDDLPHTATGRLAKHRLPRERNAQEIDLEERQAAEGPQNGRQTLGPQM